MPHKLWNRNFTLLTFSNFFMCSSYYSLISTLPIYISTELHSSKSVVGLVLASYIVASVVVRPFTGFGLDKYGRKTIFIVSLLLYALVFNGYLIAWTVAVMILVRFIHGLTWGLTTTSNSTVAIDIIPPDKRGQGIGYFGISTTLGMALGPVIGSFIFQNGGYSAMFIAGFLISLASMGLAVSMRFTDVVPSKSLDFRFLHSCKIPSGSMVQPSSLVLVTGLFSRPSRPWPTTWFNRTDAEQQIPRCSLPLTSGWAPG